ncbi:T9SS type A sorting domain-containing protein [Mangrovimonas aestuarii]|uniref:T9SS type A sorting domain-containing protein n=1 Tax=Mangrovimonas aestuarii TaxID=3018443 RepID=UPI0023783B10|nr:T9SS type A sorting domain-containing protein [Mangrovimonas aestuarii]
MKKQLLLCCFAALGTINAIGQTTFDWETIPAPISTTSLTETKDGITATFSDSDSSNNVTSLANISYGGSGNCIFSSNSDSVEFTFDTPVNVISILAMNGNPPETYTFTPTGGTNSPVIINFTSNASQVQLNWTAVTSFTVTAENLTPIIFDNLIVQNATLSTPNVAMENITIYPNPTSNYINVSLGDTYTTVNASLLSVSGRVVAQKTVSNANAFQMDLNHAAGLYFLNISTDNGKSAILKVVKK